MDAVVESDETDNLSSELQAALGVRDIDWFSFDEDAGQTIVIRLENLPADYDVELYHQNGTKVGSSSSAAQASEKITFTTTSTAWLMDSGERCGSEHQLEVDHIDAVALGGRSDPARARLLCRRHNDQHARETFGEAFMAAKKAGQRW